MEIKFNPSRLVFARQRAKLTKSELANKTELVFKTITHYEEGARVPSDSIVDRLSASLGFPKDFFYGSDLESPNASNASFRSFSRMTSAQRDSALAAGGIAFSFSEWIDSQFNMPNVDVPDLSGVDPEAAAEIVRKEWNQGLMPIKNMVHLLESRGVRVFSLVEDSKEVNAFSSWSKGRLPFIFLNTLKSSESSRFDAAHELGHLVLHRHGDPKGKEVEAEANQFASAFLMPRAEIQANAFRCQSLGDILVYKKRWNVSAMALAYRLHKLDLMTEWNYRAMCIDMSTKGYRTNEPNGSERETSQVLKKVFSALKDQGKGIKEIAKDLRFPQEELHKLIFGLTAVSLGNDNTGNVKSSARRGHLRLVSSSMHTGEERMAKNPPKGDGHRIGAVKDRTQTQTPSGNYVKRNSDNGRFMDVKSDKKPFKGVTKEK